MINISSIKNLGIWGDSILRGVVLDEERGKYKTLKETSVSIFNKIFRVNIKNNSRFGCTAPKAMINMESSLKNGYSPDAVLLEFGGNDCDFNWRKISENPDADHKPNTPIKTFCSTMENMVDMLIRKSITPILMNLPPIDGNRYFTWISHMDKVDGNAVLKWLSSPNTMYRQQERYSLEIERLALKRGLSLIDVRSCFLEIRDYSNYLCADGIHLNQKGQEVMGKVFSDFAKTVAQIPSLSSRQKLLNDTKNQNQSKIR